MFVCGEKAIIGTRRSNPVKLDRAVPEVSKQISLGHSKNGNLVFLIECLTTPF